MKNLLSQAPMEKDWLKQLKPQDVVWYGAVGQKTKKLVKIIKIHEICIFLDNGDVVDNIDGENGHRTHRILNQKITRRIKRRVITDRTLSIL